VGGLDNLTTPERIALELTAAGEFRMYGWGADDVPPFEARGHYELRGSLLTLDTSDFHAPQVFSIACDAAVLELRESGERPPLPMYFERRPWLPLPPGP
jgi:hypothetical protein